MARKRKTFPLEDLFELGSRLSWKIGLPLALLSYLAFHYLSKLPLSNGIPINKIGEFVIRQGAIALSGVFQYLVPFALLVGVVVGLFQRKRRRELLETRSGIESIREMSWQNFELLVGEAFKRKGYSVEERGGAGADGGIDLILRRDGKKVLVQCKRWKNLSIGVSHIRELYGVMVAERANGCIFVSSGNYSFDAQGFAKGKPIRLIDSEELVGLIEGVQSSGYIKSTNSRQPAMPVKEEKACLICGSHMVIRKAKRGANSGNEFLGCSRFPDCRGTKNI